MKTGYIVTSWVEGYNEPMRLWKDGILTNNSPGTIFRTYGDARNALRRLHRETKRMVKENIDVAWLPHRCKVIRVQIL